jgi:hypothetical protein
MQVSKLQTYSTMSRFSDNSVVHLAARGQNPGYDVIDSVVTSVKFK